MVEQVIFKIDKKLKERAMRKAKREGIAFSAVLKSATQAYVENDFDVSVSYSPKLIRAVRQAEKEIREGKVLYGDLKELLKRV